MPTLNDKPAVVVQAEDLATLAKRINNREKKSRKDQLDHARKQGQDLIAAKSQCKHGEWLPWLEENVSISESRCQQYMQLTKSLVTRDFPEDQQWEEWQRISGNHPEQEEQGEDQQGEDKGQDEEDHRPRSQNRKTSSSTPAEKYNERSHRNATTLQRWMAVDRGLASKRGLRPAEVAETWCCSPETILSDIEVFDALGHEVELIPEEKRGPSRYRYREGQGPMFFQNRRE